MKLHQVQVHEFQNFLGHIAYNMCHIVFHGSLFCKVNLEVH